MTPHPVDLEKLQELLDEWKAMGAHCPRSMTTDTRPGPAGIPVYDRLGIAAVNALPALLAEVRAARQATADFVPTGRFLVEPAVWHRSRREECGRCRKALGTHTKHAVRLDLCLPSALAALASPSVPLPQEPTLCLEWNPGGVYSCSLPRGHAGPHIAWDERPLATWPAPPVLEEKAAQEQRPHEACRPTLTADAFDHHPKAQETAAPKEGGEAAAFVAKLPRAPDVDFEIDPPAVSQQPGVAPAPKRHKCMRCGKEFDCPHGSSCQAKYDVLPRYFLPDGTLVDHCAPLPNDPRGAPPAPALPKEEVAPLGWCVGHLGRSGNTGEPHAKGDTCAYWRPVATQEVDRDKRILDATERNESGLWAALQEWKALRYHACVTGDCPHSTSASCAIALIETIRELDARKEAT